MIRVAGCIISILACAAPMANAASVTGDMSRNDLAVMETSLFASAHPDLLFRFSAIGLIEDGREADAFSELLKAAEFGDKPSQAMIAEAYWSGSMGQSKDRALAYAWMDLAAERRYEVLLLKREAYWNALAPGERQDALSRGQSIYAEYGDEVALPRLERRLRLALREQTGTRKGASAGTRTYLATKGVGMVVTIVARIGAQNIRPNVRGGQQVDFWEKKYWKLDDYLAWKAEAIDGEWTGAGQGRVEILPVEPDRDRS